jgi:hypothetical protein
LYIKTKGGEEYISDYVGIMDTPPIDSVAWRPDGDGVSVMVNTHDVTGQSKYYRWDYVETWEYESPFISLFKVVNKQAVYRDQDDLFTNVIEQFRRRKFLLLPQCGLRKM